MENDFGLTLLRGMKGIWEGLVRMQALEFLLIQKRVFSKEELDQVFEMVMSTPEMKVIAERLEKNEESYMRYIALFDAVKAMFKNPEARRGGCEV
jgi:hypothetical protein